MLQVLLSGFSLGKPGPEGFFNYSICGPYMNIVVLRWRAQPVTTSDITMEKNRVGSGPRPRTGTGACPYSRHYPITYTVP